MDWHPLVSLFDENGKLQLLKYPVTGCDWCGKHIENAGFELDNAIRPMFFCSEKCKDEFNAKYPLNTHSYPSIKLTTKGLFVPLKFYGTDEVQG